MSHVLHQAWYIGWHLPLFAPMIILFGCAAKVFMLASEMNEETNRRREDRLRREARRDARKLR